MTVERTVASPPPEESGSSIDESTESGSDAGSDSSGSESSGGGDCVKVPDVEGEDHQLAQDTMQGAGLYNLTEEDATGQGRLLVVDRNWTVVEQSPAAGECVTSDATVTLRSKNDYE
ncbi:MAG: PASTA domain-containing protein [Actinomycetota bacterium]|nr:PASTA domain-containing protein [Actinomycetota bacterium]